MTHPIWRKRWIQVLLFSLTLCAMLLIFFFSSENGEQSNETRGKIVQLVVRIAEPNYDALDVASQQSIFSLLQFLIRKLGHFSEYTLLGCLLRLFLQTYPFPRKGLIAWNAGAIYACSDELHQFFVGSRTAMWQDVLLDSSGVLAGIALSCFIILIMEHQYIKKER